MAGDRTGRVLAIGVRRGRLRRRRRGDDGGDDGRERRGPRPAHRGHADRGFDIPYPPFESATRLTTTGFDIDLINAIAEDLGLEVEIVDAAVRRIFLAVRRVASTSRSRRPRSPPAARTASTSPIPYFEPEQSLLVPEGSDIASIDDLTADTSSAPRTGPPARPTPNENTDAEVRGVPGERRRLQRARSPARSTRCSSTSRRRATRSRSKADLEVVETFPTDELLRDRLPADSTPGRADQRGAADGQGRRHARRASTPSGSTASAARGPARRRPTTRPT